MTLKTFLGQLAKEFPGLDKEDLREILHTEIFKRIDDETFYAGSELIGIFTEALESAKVKVSRELTS